MILWDSKTISKTKINICIYSCVCVCARVCLCPMRNLNVKKKNRGKERKWNKQVSLHFEFDVLFVFEFDIRKSPAINMMKMKLITSSVLSFIFYRTVCFICKSYNLFFVSCFFLRTVNQKEIYEKQKRFSSYLICLLKTKQKKLILTKAVCFYSLNWILNNLFGIFEMMSACRRQRHENAVSQ